MPTVRSHSMKRKRGFSKCFGCLMRSHASTLLLGMAVCLVHAARGASFVLDFNSDSQRVSTSAKITTVPFTVEAWIKLSAYHAENQVLAQYIGGHSGRMILAVRNTKPALFIGGTWLNGVSDLSLNTWTHIGATRDSGGNCVIYVNGVPDISGTVNANALSNTGLLIAGLSNGFRGSVGDVRVWNTVRSGTQLSGAMSQRLTGSEPGLIHYWKLNEGNGSAVADSVSGAGGSFSGAVWVLSDSFPIDDGTGMFDAPEYAWNGTAGGNWSDGENWLDGAVAQGVNATVWFTNQPPASVMITNDMPDLALDNIRLDSPMPHTFTGNGMTLTNTAGGASKITATEGSHVFSLPIRGSGGLIINAGTPTGGIITLSGTNTYTGVTRTGCGTLRVGLLADGGEASGIGASSSDPANLVLGPGTLHYTGEPVATDRGYTVAAGTAPIRAATLRADADLTFGGPVQCLSGAFIKSGPGTVTYTYPGVNTLGSSDTTTPYSPVQNGSAHGDSPTQGFGTFTVNDGTVVLGIPSQTNRVLGGRMLVGCWTTDAAGAETAGHLIVNGGRLEISSTFGIGWHNGTAVTAGPEGIRSTVTINGGSVQTVAISLGLNNANRAGFNARPVFIQNGGSILISDRFILSDSSSTGGATCEARFSGGTCSITGGTREYGLNIGYSYLGTVTLEGAAELDTSKKVILGETSGGRGRLNLDGGMLTASNIVKGAGAQAQIRFNGGVWRPRGDGQTLAGLTLATVSTNGAAFDLSLVSGYTVAQPLLHDDDLGETQDGGLFKTGAGTLTFTGANTYTGPTRILAGTLTPGAPAALPAGGAVLFGVAPGDAGGRIHAADDLSLEGRTAGVANPEALDTHQTYTLATWGGTLTHGFATADLPEPWVVHVDAANKRMELRARKGTLIRLR
jgi:autotransporter-associated beta strand protein